MNNSIPDSPVRPETLGESLLSAIEEKGYDLERVVNRAEDMLSSHCRMLVSEQDDEATPQEVYPQYYDEARRYIKTLSDLTKRLEDILNRCAI